MTNKKVRTFNEHGGWMTPHQFYFPMAQNFLSQAENLHNSLDQKENELMQDIGVEGTEWEKSEILGYIHNETRDDRNQLVALAETSQIFACMAVEAFLNFYGVKRLGEKYYKRNIERLGINQKLEILIAICLQELIEDKDELAGIVKKMFDRRNRLVHPKSKEMVVNGEFVFPELRDELEEARKAVDEMSTFFNKFQEIDESMEFSNPNYASA